MIRVPIKLFIFIGLFLQHRTALANAVGSDFQNFNPTSNGIDFVTVQSSETLEPGFFNLGLFLNYAINPLPEFGDQEKERGELRNSLLGLDLNLGLGIAKDWDIGVNLPFTASQSIEEENERIQLQDRGLNEVRLNVKYRIAGSDRGGVAVVGTVNLNTIENNPYSGQDPGPIANIELVGDMILSGFTVGANVGYRARSEGEAIEDVPVEPLGDQWLYSLAVAKLLANIDTQIIGEIYGTVPASNDVGSDARRNMNSSEVLIGAKFLVSDSIAIHGGVATYLSQNANSPDYRIYSGINWTFGPAWGKKQSKVLKRKPSIVLPPPPPEAPTYPEVDPLPAPIVYVLENVEFGFNSANKLRPGSLAEIHKLGQILVRSTYSKVKIIGHTDSLGSTEYNLKLSQQRANTIINYLLKNFKINPKLIEAVGMGESQPIAENNTLQGRQKNRRVEFKIYK